ncbi:MAG: hypothetical protein RMM53_01310, partial [Bacteroidia bacterium]|nr:hypothetical protein [Bacteroidia bacterium]
MKLTLGIDLGANSVGWALLNEEEGEIASLEFDATNYTGKIVDGGVRVFTEGVNKMGQGENELSRNAERRQARMMRRQYFRRRKRKKKLLNWLKKHGFLPKDVGPMFFTVYDPYKIRKEGLERPLTPGEFAVALYHLNRRRGYKSGLKAGNKSEEKPILEGDPEKGIAGIKDLNYDSVSDTFRIGDKVYPTLGACLWGLKNQKDKRIRSRFTRREWYLSEFEKLWEAQKNFNPISPGNPFNILHDETTEYRRVYHIKNGKQTLFKTIIGAKAYVRDEIIFFQRPLKSQKGKVGYCLLEKKSRRCPASHPVAQRFAMLQQINNLKVAYKSKDKSILRSKGFLYDEEKRRLVQYLSQHEEITVDEIFEKILGLDLDENIVEKYEINLATQGKIKGERTLVKICRAIGEESFSRLTDDQKEHLWRLIYDSDDSEWLARKVMAKYGFTQEQATKFSKIELEKSYAMHSLKAMKNLLPYLEAGMI